jgi:uncharacterized membrane protein YedE/YeeE
MKLFKYLIAGTWFGLLLTKGEVISWFRIRDMFFFREPDLFLIIGSAVVTGMVSMVLLRKTRTATLEGDPLVVPDKSLTKGNYLGGFLFGLGWFITGACPGPIFAQIGAGETLAWIALAGALLGTYVYARFRPRLPH